MKNLKVFTSTLITMFLCCMLSAQCPQGEISLTSQQQVDNFASAYPGCTELLDNLKIAEVGSNVSNLNGLSGITSIAGELVINYNDMLTTLSGLENLHTIGGLSIILNDNLTSIEALENIGDVPGDFSVRFNNISATIPNFENLTAIGGNLDLAEVNLVNMEVFGNLTTLGGSLSLYRTAVMNLVGLENLTVVGGLALSNNNLTTLEGLENLHTIEGTFSMFRNSSLTSLTALSSLTSIGSLAMQPWGISDFSGLEGVTSIDGDVTINETNSITSLNGLQNLISIGGNLRLYRVRNITNLDGLENLTSIEGGSLSFSENNGLANIDGLSNLDFSTINELRINSSPNLTTCHLDNVCDYLAQSGHIVIYNNAADCDSEEALLAACDVSVPCPPGNIEIATQNQLNNFIAQYPDCTNIPGDLLIGSASAGNNIDDLSGLSQITSIGHDLIIRRTNYLEDLNGLDNITTVGGKLDIYDNESLAELHGLEALTSVGLRVFIHDNHVLTDLTGLDNLTTIGEDLNISSNGWLTHLTGLGALQSIGGDLRIYSSQPALKSLSGLEALTSIAGWISITNNSGLVSLSGLRNVDLTGITDLGISGNNRLSVCNFQNICDYLANGGNASISDNAPGCANVNQVNNACASNAVCPSSVAFVTQRDVDDFPLLYPNCTQIPGDMIVGGQSNNIQDFSPINQITRVGEDFMITNLDNVSDLSHFSNINQVNGDLYMLYNDGLTNLDGLSDINVGRRLTIQENYNLADLSQASNVSVRDIFIYRSPNLTSLNGFNNISVANEIRIGSNDALINLNGMEHINTLIGLLDIFGNDNLTSLTGLENINSLGSLVIYDNENLNSLSGLTNLQLVSDYANIWSNDVLPSLAGLENLNSVGGSLSISFNDMLLSLTGLENLNYIGDQLAIRDNDDLTSISAIQNIHPDSLDFLTIEYNSELSACSVSSICQYLEDGGDSDIGGNEWNNPGCNSAAEVQDACDVTPPDNPCGGTPSTDSHTHIFDQDLFIDGVGFNNNPIVTFTDPATPTNAVLSDISLELYFRLNGNTCENEIAIQITDPAGNTQPLTAFTTCDGGNGLYYVNLDVPSGNTAGSVADWVVEFDDTNDQNSDYEYSVRFARLNYVATTGGGSGETVVNEVSEIADNDLFIDGVGFENNGTYTFADPGTPADAVLSDISLELYFRLNGNSCENEIAIQITDPAGNTQALTAYTTCDGGNSLYYVNLNVPSGNTTGSTADWVVEFDDTNDQNTGYEYSVRFGRLTYTTTHTAGGGGTPVTVNDTVSENADSDLFIDGVGFENNDSYTFTDPGTPADAVLSDISLELYFRLNGNSCENEIAIQITDPAGNTQPLTAYTTCDGGNGLYYVNLNVPSGNTTGSVADWTVQFDDTNDQNSGYEYSVRFGRLTYDAEYTECLEMLTTEENTPEQEYSGTLAYENIAIQHDLSDVSIFPNPTTGTFQVKGISEGTYFIHDATGRTIQHGNMTNDLSIDISQEVQGMYFISIQMENETITKRIIKM